MKTYKIEFTIKEGDNDFWNDFKSRNVTGCDDVLALFTKDLYAMGFDSSNIEVRLTEFTDK